MEHPIQKCLRICRRGSIALTVSAVLMSQLGQGSASAAASQTVIEAESMFLPAKSGQVFNDATASQSRGLLLWSNSTATATVTVPAAGILSIRAKGDQCKGAPKMEVLIDGKLLDSKFVSSTAWSTYVAGQISAGSRQVAVRYSNDVRRPCDRNLRLDSLTVESTTTEATPIPTPTSAPLLENGNPFATGNFFVDPNSAAKKQADAWRDSRPVDATMMDRIAAGAQADWFGGWSGDIRTAVQARTTTIETARSLPVLVAYNIPQRDCGGYSAGGVGSPEAYRTWIDGFAAGISSTRAAVILEPDALAGMDCLSATDRQARLDLLKYAVTTLSARPGTAVYLDAGHAGWKTPAEMASRLQAAGLDQARGFSLNVSNFDTTVSETTYGTAISNLVAQKPFVIDTSRNGQGKPADGQWCNPTGRGLGYAPTAVTNNPLIDAYFWVKRPGESDGTCNGGPSAGQWWSEYALGLAQRAI